ncbi:MAG: hypothetical protein HWQ38_37980 [Nostoc sp. NMS7]|uniref:hypothetical protein n=1 Tax=Nostoc sp. NMS7 TaxID=2815391 RepID=UPI0025F7E29F|nr:hypothetical protein [Nostoc sp. NMS7]MBN3951948.1 hypothetical protein [Nostoc sp. NMS7]
MIDSEQQLCIRTTLRDCRREGLIKFVEEFITLLEQEGFSFQDLLEALAAWMFRQRPNPEEVIKHLEDAALELHRNRS